jgi:hypothetical protein
VDKNQNRLATAPREHDRVFVAIVCAGVIANHLRRTAGHRVDIAWLVRDRGYACHILRLAKECGNAAIIERAQRLEVCLFGQHS